MQKVKIVDVHLNKRTGHTHAVLRYWETREHMISATLDYILVACEEHGYDIVTISMKEQKPVCDDTYVK